MTSNSPPPLLSVVVPTRNRYATLRVLIDQVMGWTETAFELVVEDNSTDTGAIADVILRYGSDLRFKYAHSADTRSAIENCDAATARARGQVVVFIGDDDTITRQCIDSAQWMVDTGAEVLLCDVGSYVWPDTEHAIAINKLYNGRLVDADMSGRLERVDVRSELASLARNGAQALGHVPRLYQSLVRRDVLEAMRTKLGTCFPGPVPDMANAVAMAPMISQCYWTDLPIVVAGQSKNSMSGRNSVRAHQGAISAEASLPSGAADRWDTRVPAYWSAPTVWAEAAIKAATATGQTEFVRKFSFARLYAACLSYNRPEYYPLVFRAMYSRGLMRGLLVLPKTSFFVAKITLQRAIFLARKIAVGIPGLPFANVADAANYIERKFIEDQLVERMLAKHTVQSA